MRSYTYLFSVGDYYYFYPCLGFCFWFMEDINIILMRLAEFVGRKLNYSDAITLQMTRRQVKLKLVENLVETSHPELIKKIERVQ